MRAGTQRGSWLIAAATGGMVAVGMMVLSGLAQPGRGEGEPGRPGRGRVEQPAGPGADRGPMNAADVRARMQRRLDEVRVAERRLEETIERLDAGEDPERVVREMYVPGLARPPEGAVPGGPGPEPRGPLDPQEREAMMARLREVMPRVAEWVVELERDDPRVMEAVHGRLLAQVREIDRIRERDPQGARIRTAEIVATMNVMRTTRAYRMAARQSGADSRVAAHAAEGLRSALAEQFDAKLAANRHEIESLGQRLDALRADVAAQVEGRDRLIDDAWNRILTDASSGPGRGRPPG